MCERVCVSVCVIVSVGVFFNTFKVVRRLIRGRSYALQVKCIHMVKLVWVVFFCGGQGRGIVYFYRK